MPSFIDYLGKKIGRVTIQNLHEKKSGGTRWNCMCDCGVNFICWNASFKRGSKFECKECWYERRRGIDLTGRQFGRWTVLSRFIDEHNKTKWKCRCDCGTEGLVSGNVLGKKGRSMSCGCLGRKMKSKHVNTTLYPPKHGLSQSGFYTIKTSLIHKCYNEQHPSFKNFGAKGITVCDLWRNGVKDMYNWAIENGWQKSDVLVLKDGQNEFNPLTTFILKENDFRSDVALKGGFQITYNGETHSVRKWAEILDTNPISLRRRLKMSPSIEQVFSSKFPKHYFIRKPELLPLICQSYQSGKSIKQISKELQIPTETIRYQLVKNNITIRNDTKLPKRPDVKDEDIINLLYIDGLSTNEISKRLNMSWGSVKKRISKLADKQSIC